MIQGYTVEICAGSLSDVTAALSAAETDRIELNCALELGGLTPSIETFRLARARTEKKIICMVRPRPAGFVFNDDEKETMYRDAETFLAEGADGIVFGCLNDDLTVDADFAGRMCSLIHSYGKEAVFHKAFDETPDQEAACGVLISAGADRILTSGGAPDVISGLSRIASLRKKYGSRIEILPGGGVNEDTVLQLLKETGCTSFHMSAKSVRKDCGEYFAVDAAKIRTVLDRLRSAFRRELSGEDIRMLKNDTYEDSLIRYEDDGRERY